MQIRFTAAALAVLLSAASTTPAAGAKPGAPGFHKVLFLGNSITRHGPKPDIGWTNNWGMAASALEKDYVHLVTKGLAEAAGFAPEVLIDNISEFERQYATYDAGAKMKKDFAFGADLVIVAIGENTPALATDDAKAQFKSALMKVLNGLRAGTPPVVVVRSCFWPNAAKDEVLRECCREAGGVFVDIAALGKDETNSARSERAFANAGVGAHPGDKGMQAIANAILEAIRGAEGKRAVK